MVELFMKCPRCQIEYNAQHWGECPHCGQRRAEGYREGAEGVVKTSTILISTDDGGIFHSLEEVPEPLREALASSTSGANSATIVIADQGGRARISAALQNLPGHSQSMPLVEAGASAVPFWRRASLFWAILLFCAFAGALVWFLYRRLP